MVLGDAYFNGKIKKDEEKCEYHHGVDSNYVLGREGCRFGPF